MKSTIVTLIILFISYVINLFALFGYDTNSVNTIRIDKKNVVKKDSFLGIISNSSYKMIIGKSSKKKMVRISNRFYCISFVAIPVIFSICLCLLFIDMHFNWIISDFFESNIVLDVLFKCSIGMYFVIIFLYRSIMCDYLKRLYIYGTGENIECAFAFSTNQRNDFCHEFKDMDGKSLFFPYVDYRVEDITVCFYLHIDFFNGITHEYEEYIEQKTASVNIDGIKYNDYKEDKAFIDKFKKMCNKYPYIEQEWKKKL